MNPEALEKARDYVTQRGLQPYRGSGYKGSTVLAAWNAQRKKKRSADYAAGQSSRLISSWGTTSVSANQEIFRSLRALRARSRELSRNNPFAKRFLMMVAANVVGPSGIGLQCRAGEFGRDGKFVSDDVANAIIEREWPRFNRRGVCEVTGRLSGPAFDRLYAITLARDGEVLIKRVRGSRSGNVYGYAWQFIDIDRLDETYNTTTRDGNLIRMGIELNEAGRAVAYHLRRRHPGDHWMGGLAGDQYDRIPAEDIWHDFIQDRPEQIRGVPWMHAAMVRLWQLGEFEDAAVVAARIGASKVGVIQSPGGEPPENVATGKDSEGNFLTDIESGQYWTLPPGYELQGWDPGYPDAAVGPFVKACLRGIASGMAVSYNGLANDLEGVNFSSIRQGVLDERDGWKMIQGWMCEGWKMTSFADWLETSLMSGALAPLPLLKFNKFNAPDWHPRRWSWVDPLKDVQAAILAVNAGLRSRRQVMAEQGLDFEDTLNELASEQKMAADAGVALNVPAKITSKTENDDDDASKTKD